MRNVSDKICREIKTWILFSITFYFRKSRRLSDNVQNFDTAKQATGDNTIRSVLFACRMDKGERTSRKLGRASLTAASKNFCQTELNKWNWIVLRTQKTATPFGED
jgi:hypothetical protein